MLIAVLPLARETFDIELARSIHLEMMDRLAGCQHRILGGGALITDTESLIREFDRLGKNRPDRVLILQVTFTDAEACEYIAGNFSGPLSIWAVDEPRTGGRLRLNSFLRPESCQPCHEHGWQGFRVAVRAASQDLQCAIARSAGGVRLCSAGPGAHQDIENQ